MRVQALKGPIMPLAHLTDKDADMLACGRLKRLKPRLVVRPEALMPIRESGRLERINAMLREAQHA